MKILLCFITFMMNHSVFAETILRAPDDKTPLTIITFKNIRLSETSCKNSCLAKLAIEKKPQIIQIKKGGTNPTSNYCESIQGTPDIYYFPDQSEVSVCVFKDKSFLLTWDLLK